MEGRLMGWCILALGMLGFAASAIVSSNDISCWQALLPCQSYFDKSGPATPSVECCLGVHKVLSHGISTTARQNLCECFKEVVVPIGVDPSRAYRIPHYCHASLPFPLDPNIDCSAIPS